MSEMKDSGIEWIGEIPKGWKVSRIKQLFSEVNDRCENGENYTLLSVSEYYGVAPKSERISDDDMLTHAETLDGYKICNENDLVMNIMLAWKRALGVSEYTGIVSPAYCIYRGKQNMCAKYFHYLFRTDVYANLFKQYSTGIIDSRLRLYPDKFLSLKCQVPPLGVQRRIADYLDRKCSQIDAIIARQQEVIEKLKTYKLSVITEAVTKGLNPDVPMKDSGIEWIGKTPKHWQLTKIKWVADTCSGGTPPSGDLSFYDGGINWVCSYDLHEDAIKCTQRTLSEEGAEIIAGKMQKPNSILIAMYGGSGTIGNSGILSCYARTNQAVCSVYFDEKLMNPKFALYQTIFMRKYWMYYAVGSRKDPNISQDTIRNMHYIIPPMQEQEAIVEWIESRINVVECIQRKKSNIIEKLADYKKSLIYEVVTGKKEV